MKRSFKTVVLTTGGTPQPVFGSTTSAAVPASPSSPISIQVADSSWFRQGDYMLLDPKGSNPELILIDGVPDATHVKLHYTNFSHASGVFVQLSMACYSVYIQPVVDAAGIYIGTSPNMVKATGAFCIKILPTALPNDFTDVNYGLGNVENPSNYWFDGSTSDSILPSLSTI